jgi:hypothetical protein
MAWIFAHRNAAEVLGVFGILSFPSSLISKEVSECLLGDVYVSRTLVGSFIIMAFFGILQYILVGLLLREMFGDFFGKR